MSYVEGRSLNKSYLSISVGIKDIYCNSQKPKPDPQNQKELFKSIDPLILKLSKSEIGNQRKLEVEKLIYQLKRQHIQSQAPEVQKQQMALLNTISFATVKPKVVISNNAYKSCELEQYIRNDLLQQCK